jgi:hypothetical protein
VEDIDVYLREIAQVVEIVEKKDKEEEILEGKINIKPNIDDLKKIME